ncbi:MAG: Cation efflux system protein CusB [Bacteroidia bacterium]|nr:Cation efflux system protein CusB [Bacteroidia bacterium]
MRLKALFFLLTTLLSLGSCKQKEENYTEHTGIYYTCPMHPSVISSIPGSCPVCNMSLIKVEKKENSHEGHKGNFITLDKRQQLLAGIETDTVKFRTIIPASTILGTVAIDEEQVTTISSRVKGRIDKLYIKTSGEYIRKGNPVYSIYSEKLFADENEFLSLSEKKKQENNSSKFLDDMLTAAKNKLLLWGLSENQVSEIEKNKTASPQITFYSKEEGYVTEVSVKEGMYVEEGTTLIKISGLKQVWILAQVYTNEKINDNNSFQVYSATSPDEVYNGRLVFNNPSVEEGRKIQLLRIRVDNTKNKLVPGMMVYVNPKKITQPVLSIPKSALLLEKMKTVWIKTDETTFEQRMVETGTENKYLIEILSGIKEGEIIVTSGAYLISSEFILKSGAGQRHEH